MQSYYHQQYEGHAAPEQVVIQSKVQQRPTVVHEAKPRWSWCSTGWSICSMICCTPFFLCGLLGLVFSLTSYADHKTDDFDRSRYKRNCSWGCTITAIVLGLLLLLAILLIIFVSPWGDWVTDWYSSLV